MKRGSRRILLINAGMLVSAMRRGMSVALVFAATMAVRASEPVPRVIEGCVRDGIFTSNDGYVIRPQQRIGEPLDLTAFQGRAVTLAGDLLPGDLMILKQPPQDKGACTRR